MFLERMLLNDRPLATTRLLLPIPLSLLFGLAVVGSICMFMAFLLPDRIVGPHRWLPWLCIGVAALMMACLRRSVSRAYGNLTVRFHRVSSRRFVLHIKRRRGQKTSANQIDEDEFSTALDAVLNPRAIAEILECGGKEIQVASLWFHREPRVDKAGRLFARMFPEARVSRGEFPLGVVETITIRVLRMPVIQLLVLGPLEFILSWSRNRSGPVVARLHNCLGDLLEGLRPYRTFARLVRGKLWRRPMMPGFLITLETASMPVAIID